MLKGWSRSQPWARASRAQHLALLLGVPVAVLVLYVVMLHLDAKAIEQKGAVAYEYRRLDLRIRALGIRGTDSEALEAANPPFVPQPSAAQHAAYLDCLLAPALLAGGAEASCADFAADAEGPAAQERAVLVDHARCAPLSGFLAADVRTLPFLPAAVYLRPGTADGAALSRALCGDFAFLPKTVPYIPRSRPLVVLDAGSGSGYSGTILSRVMRFQGTLVSVEPDPERALLARRNAAAVQGTAGLHLVAVNRALVSAADAKRTPELPLRAVGVEEAPAGQSVRTISLAQLLERARVPAFDFVRLDIAGTEAALLREATSRSVLCAARCVFVAAAGDAQGSAAAAWRDFVEGGCPTGDGFRDLEGSGAFRVACRDSVRL